MAPTSNHVDQTHDCLLIRLVAASSPRLAGALGLGFTTWVLKLMPRDLKDMARSLGCRLGLRV